MRRISTISGSRLWVVAGLAAVIIASGLTLATPLKLQAAEPVTTQQCQSCHQTTLKGHDKLGAGSNACLVCHSTDMKTLRLVDGTQVPLSEPSRVCGQCHQQRYNAWKEGTHGLTEEQRTSVNPAAVKSTCTSCHRPHQPQIVLTGLTKPHPAPAPPPPAPPFNLMLMSGAALVVMAIAAGVLLA